MPFINKEQERAIVAAIEAAELNTSGEIRVHIESKCSGDAIGRAIYLFRFLKMDKTEQRNGVLIYVAYRSRKFAIIGDAGINARVPENFWEEIKCNMGKSFASGDYVGGICNAIHQVGNSLREYFPYGKDDVNEQPNEISFGD